MRDLAQAAAAQAAQAAAMHAAAKNTDGAPGGGAGGGAGGSGTSGPRVSRASGSGGAGGGGRGGRPRKNKVKAGGEDQTAKHMQILKKLLHGPSGDKVRDKSYVVVGECRLTSCLTAPLHYKRFVFAVTAESSRTPRYFPGFFDDSDCLSRFESRTGLPTQSVTFDDLLTRPNPTREISNVSRPEQTRPASFFIAPIVTRGPDRDQ